MTTTATCAIPACPLPAVAKGLCKNHYEVERRRQITESNDGDYCVAPDCDRRALVDELCDRHYRQILHNGRFGTKWEPEPRFWAKVDKSGPTPAPHPVLGDLGPCWLWTGLTRGTQVDRYGTFKVKGKTVSVHRYAYELMVGPIPDGLTIDHLCKTSLCVRAVVGDQPGQGHLEAVTLAENILRGDNMAALFARRDSCYRGHSFEPPNGYLRPDGARGCHECDRIRGAAARAKRPAP